MFVVNTTQSKSQCWLVRVLDGFGRSLLLIMLVVFVTAGCTVAESKATANTLKFAPGIYEATLSGSRMAKIEIDKELGYRYLEDSPRNGLIRQVSRKGNLLFSTWRKAKAGNIKLEWMNEDTIRVVSPFSSTIGNGNNEGNMAYSSGPFLSGMPSHTFYMNRVGEK